MKKQLAKVTSSYDVDEFSEIIAVVEYITISENSFPEMKKDVNKIKEATSVSSYTIFHNRYEKDKLKIEQSGIGIDKRLIEVINQELDLEGTTINDTS